MIMRMKHLLKRSEREAIGDEYGESPIMAAFHCACLQLGIRAQKYALSEEDLFYHCFFSIDVLLGRREKEAIAYFSNLWEEMRDFIEEKWDGADEEDVRLAVSTIVDSVAEILVRTGKPRFVNWAGILKRQIEEHHTDANEVMDKAFGKGFDFTDQILVKEKLNEYFGNGRLVSEEAERLMDGVAEEPLYAKPTAGQTNQYFIMGNVGCAGGTVETQMLAEPLPQKRISNE